MIRREILSLPAVNRREVLRYAAAREETPELAALLDSTLPQLLPALSGQVCWMEFPILRRNDSLDLGFAAARSAALDRNLADCDRIVVFAASIGLAPDRLIARYGRTAPARALLVQAIGAERIEALCDAFCDKLRQDYKCALSPRFSPGYGDLPLELQTSIFRVLDCPRQIGLTLNDSFLMSPSKSVTAIVGLGKHLPGCTTGCSQCGKTDCAHRRMP